MKRPVIGITMGDPSGNGPELSVKACMHKELYESCKPLIVGDFNVMADIKKTVKGAESFTLNRVTDLNDAKYEFGTIDVLDLNNVDLSKRVYRNDLQKLKETVPEEEYEEIKKTTFSMCGEAAYRYVEKVIMLALENEIDATVTNALNKDHLNTAGHHYSGHTEIYADLTHTKKYTMMLAHHDLRVVHVSTHVSMREACDRVKKARVLECIRIADEGCKALGIEKPKIGVAGLNCHCGENGLFGREEIDEIQPAIDEALKEEICIPDKAPTPPDTIFSKALGGWYDIVVAMYHDQGHIPLKVKGFVYNKDAGKWDAVEGINVTLGLPIIRASVDHGTGEDQAGLGVSSELSLLNAIDYAVKMANVRVK